MKNRRDSDIFYRNLELYSRDLCGCLSLICFIETILLGIPVIPVDRSMKKLCDNRRKPIDCADAASTWRTITFGFSGMTILILCFLLVSLMSLYRERFSRPRRHYFRPWVLAFGHIWLQICAVLLVLVSFPQILYRDPARPGSRDTGMATAACGIVAFEIGVALWIYGTAMFLLELMMRPFRITADVGGNITGSWSWGN